MRSVYLIMFLNTESMRERIKKICDSFNGERFDIPTEKEEFDGTIKRVQNSI